MSTDNESQPELPHSRYERSNRASYPSQQECADAWADDQYPTHNNGRLYSSPNFHGTQNADGSGELMHYRTREAIRTQNGIVIDNHECWAAGFAHCSPPTDVDARLPLDAIETVADHSDAKYIVEVIDAVTTETVNYAHMDGPEEREYMRPDYTVAVFPGYDDPEDEYGVCIGRDPSATSRDSMYFVFKIPANRVEDAREHGVESMMEDMLTPPAVKYSELPAVHSGEYRKTRLDEEEAEAHEAAGGDTHRPENSYRRERGVRMNRQFHRADLQGEVICRHGEWFFIPDPEIDDDDVTLSHNVESDPTPRTRLDNHRALDDAGQLDDGTIVVRGRITHANGDHNMVHLGERWHKAVTHGIDALTYDPNPSSGFGGGWD